MSTEQACVDWNEGLNAQIQKEIDRCRANIAANEARIASCLVLLASDPAAPAPVNAELEDEAAVYDLIRASMPEGISAQAIGKATGLNSGRVTHALRYLQKAKRVTHAGEKRASKWYVR